jgi:hypothetical protein
MGVGVLRKITLLIVVLIVLGCTGLDYKRTVHANKIISNNPKLYIKVSSDLTYEGNPTRDHKQKSTSGKRLLNYHRDGYCFIKDDEKVVDKAIVVEIVSMDGSFISDFWDEKKVYADKGVTKCGTKSFQYYTKATNFSTEGYLYRHIRGRAFNLPYGLVKAFGRVYGKAANHLVIIYYYERLRDSKFGYKTWNNPENHTPEQKAFLKSFNQRALAAFEVIK